MSTRDEQVRQIIAQQAGDWFVAHRAGSLDKAEREAFDAWLTASPLHVEEYLGVALIARLLPVAADDPEVPLDGILARVREVKFGDAVVPAVVSALPLANETRLGFARPWQWAAVAATLVIVTGMVLWWNGNRATVEQYATQHGELRSWRLADQSTLRLNTDTSVTVRYSRAERLIEIERGEALFEDVHEPVRPFRVLAGTTSVVALGTTFDVYRVNGSTLVTVVQGRVAVSTTAGPRQTVTVGEGEQTRVMDGQTPTQATPADVQRNTAWLRRQIVFEQQSLAVVAAEFNRYSAIPIEIETPELRSLQISGVFSADDPETLVAFLKSLDGVRVVVTRTRIRVSRM